ncbi:hypothetical protein GCM10025857_17950 [Alicyclobacillus contaminans]|nr:hypothetical protein GCM10025857_17950 [Alicyclobacillus contaminans]
MTCAGPQVRRVSGESSSVGETDLRKVQGDPPQGQRDGHLRKPETQATPGIMALPLLRLVTVRQRLVLCGRRIVLQ